MSVTPINTASAPAPSFIPSEFRKIGYEDFNDKFRNRQLAAEDMPIICVKNAVVAERVAECLVLFVLNVDRKTQKPDTISALHVTARVDLEELDSFLSDLNFENEDLFLYLAGGNKTENDHEGFYSSFKDSLNKFLQNKTISIREEIGLINQASDEIKGISIGLSLDGEINWCYETEMNVSTDKQEGQETQDPKRWENLKAEIKHNMLNT